MYRRFRFCVLCKHSSTLLIHSPRTSNKDRSHILCTSVYFFFSGWVCMSSLNRRNAEQITLSKMVGRSRFSDVPIIAIKSLHYSAFPPQYGHSALWKRMKKTCWRKETDIAMFKITSVTSAFVQFRPTGCLCLFFVVFISKLHHVLIVTYCSNEEKVMMSSPEYSTHSVRNREVHFVDEV